VVAAKDGLTLASGVQKIGATVVRMVLA